MNISKDSLNINISNVIMVQLGTLNIIGEFEVEATIIHVNFSTLGQQLHMCVNF